MPVYVCVCVWYVSVCLKGRGGREKRDRMSQASQVPGLFNPVRRLKQVNL